MKVEPSHSPSNRGIARKDDVAERIKRFILRERLHPGDALPTEAELGAVLESSRSSIREAIKTLSALDIVEVRHGHGTFVGKLSLAALVESLAFRGLLSRNDDHAVLAELIEVRQMLEQGLAGPIIAAMDDTRQADLAALARQMRRRAARGEDFIEQDRAFHLALMAPLGNELVVQLTGAFWDVHAIVAPVLAPAGPDGPVSADAHAAIVHAAAAGDVDRLHTAIAAHYAPIRRRVHAAPAHGPGSAD